MVVVIPIATITSGGRCPAVDLNRSSCRCSVWRSSRLVLVVVAILVVMVVVGEVVMVVMVSAAEEITSRRRYVVTLTVFFTWGKFRIYNNSGCRRVVMVIR